VAQGADVGDDSLIYANISCEAPPHVFEVSTLKPYYDAVAKFMNVQKIPDNRWTDRMKLMQKGEGRNRPDFPAVAPQICLISLGIQAKSVLSERIFFNPFGVRFGVRSVNLS